MSETRRAWTPEAVKELLTRLADIGAEMRQLVLAEERVAEVLEAMQDEAERFKEEVILEEEEEPEAEPSENQTEYRERGE